MKKILNKIIILSLIFCVLSLLIVEQKNYAALFADYDDATADAESEKQLEQQEETDKQNESKSDNNYLSELSVEGYELTPAFDKNTTDYEIKDDVTADSIKINAKAEDSKATISGAEEKTLETGENVFDINVYAENSSLKVYHISVNKKLTHDNNKLNKLVIKEVLNDGTVSDKEVQLSPTFDSDVFGYTCDVSYNTAELSIEATNTSGDPIERIGNEDLKVGDNTVIVSSGFYEQAVKYKITVTKESYPDIPEYEYDANTVSQENKGTKNINYIVVGICILAIVVVFIIILTKVKGKKNKRSKHSL